MRTGRAASSSQVERGRALVAATLPDAARTELLRACLWSGERGDAAWRGWLARADDPVLALDGARSLMPLLATRAADAATPAGLRTLLRAAYVRERSRWATYREIAAAVLAALVARGVVPVVLKGAALAESAYDEPWLRHCHDVDLLVRAARLGDATTCIIEHGFRRTAHADAGPAHLAFVHGSGLPLLLHTEPFLPRAYATTALATAALTRGVCGVPVRVLAPAAALVHACGHASYHRGGERLRWACDAWSLIARTDRLDWDTVPALGVAAGLALPLSVQLEFLSRALGAPIPDAVLAALRRSPVSTDAARAAALGALCGSRRDAARVLASVGPVDRVASLVALAPALILRARGVAAGFPLPSPRGRSQRTSSAIAV